MLIRTPTVSILLPVYNGKRYLKEAIESVLSQSFQDFEFVIIDDCSSDESYDVIKSYNDSRIRRLRNKENLGLTGNWNHCLQMSQGRFVTMLHQDDVMLPQNLDTKVSMLQKTHDRWVASDCMQIDADGKLIHEHWFRHSIALSVADKNKQAQFDKMFFKSNYLCFPTILWERGLSNEVGLFSKIGGYCADGHMWLRFLNKARFSYIPEQLVKYRWAQNLSLTYDDFDWFYDDWLARQAIVDEFNLGWRYRLFVGFFRGFGFLKRFVVLSLRGEHKKAQKMMKGFQDNIIG